jgi:hypothetical protein
MQRSVADEEDVAVGLRVLATDEAGRDPPGTAEQAQGRGGEAGAEEMEPTSCAPLPPEHGDARVSVDGPDHDVDQLVMATLEHLRRHGSGRTHHETSK